MPPRHLTLPPAQTSSAKEALQSFYCALCAKGYSRMNDYEAHLSSYDHSHKQRLKDMKAMVRDPTAAERSRRAEAKEHGLVSIKLQGGEPAAAGAKKGGFKKAGFKSAFASTAVVAAPPVARPTKPGGVGKEAELRKDSAATESDTEDEGYEMYNPRFPTN